MNELPLNQILCGDCAELLQGLPSNSIDLVVTDPPYGLRFMGKEWDRVLPPVKAFEQMIRVLKPGALAFVMSSPRQDLMWRMCALLEGVGFEMRQSFISWIYKTGFPKAFDVSKGIDRRLRGDLIRSKVNYFTNKRGLSLKELAEKLDIPDAKKTLWDWLFDGHSPSNKNWLKVKEVLYVSDEEEKQFEREIIGKRRNERNMPLPTLYDGDRIDLDITSPATDLARQWDGWKSQTGLKPALEPILMVNKPFSESTIVDNVLRWGTGAINVDATRIPFQNKEDAEYVEGKHDSVEGIPRSGGNTYQWKDYEGKRTNGYTQLGRFPANLLVSDGALDTGEITGAGITGSGVVTNKNRGEYLPHNVYGERKVVKENTPYVDTGDQSRYFSLDAWAQHHGFLDVPKPDTSERDYGLKGKKTVPKSKFNLNDGSKDERFDGAVSIPRRNTHPTVKPIKLMAYLIELGCPRNGVVLDPFVGSGTTCIAAKQIGRRYIGIEISEEYHALAEARVAAYPQPLEWFQKAQDVRE